jgi:hypothetical protein
MHIKPTGGCQISTLIFGLGGSYSYPLSQVKARAIHLTLSQSGKELCRPSVIFHGICIGLAQIQISKSIFDSLLIP